MQYTLWIGNEKHEVESVEHAQRLYAAYRNLSGYGASQWPTGRLVGLNGLELTVSYNARVWDKKVMVAEAP